MTQYVVIYENLGKSWSASSTDLPKVFAVGCRSRAEARRAMTIGIRVHVESLRKAGKALPKSRHAVGIVSASLAQSGLSFAV